MKKETYYFCLIMGTIEILVSAFVVLLLRNMPLLGPVASLSIVFLGVLTLLKAKEYEMEKEGKK